MSGITMSLGEIETHAFHSKAKRNALRSIARYLEIDREKAEAKAAQLLQADTYLAIDRPGVDAT